MTSPTTMTNSSAPTWATRSPGWAWPVSRREYHLLPRRLQITTGRFAEHWIVSTLLLAGLGYLLWRDTGMAGIVHHLDTMERTGA